MRERLSSLARPSFALLCGFLGAALFTGGLWSYRAVQDFNVMRQVVPQLVDYVNKQQAAQKPAEKP